MNKTERGKKTQFATRLTRPWRRFVRLRTGGRNRVALAWQQTQPDCCRQVRGTG